MNKILITGGCGFVGTNMVRLLQERYPQAQLTVWDNFHTGKKANIQSGVSYLDYDLGDDYSIDPDTDLVIHLAAHADIRNGDQDQWEFLDLHENIGNTIRVLTAMKKAGCRRIIFTSTAPVYGEHIQLPTPEYASMPVQTSTYAASKLAAEGYISSYCHYFGFEAYIFRPVSMLGPYYSHGHVIDFYTKLKANPRQLDILGNGRANKSYVHVQDACRAMLDVAEGRSALHKDPPVVIHNLGLDEFISVKESAQIIAQTMGLNPFFNFTSKETRGWRGDVPFVWLDCDRLKKTGWLPEFTLRESIRATVTWLMKQDAPTPF